MLYEYNGMSPKIDPSAFVFDTAVIIGDVRIGPRCYIGPGAVLRGDLQPIIIGEESAVEDCVVIHCGHSSCEIGRRVTIGHCALIHGRRIADGANIGMGAIISISAEIGEYAVVAEGAVVKQGQIVPPRVVVGGTPARVLRQLEEKDIQLWEKSKDIYAKTAADCLSGSLRRLD